MDKILESVKKAIGIINEDTSFDVDLIIHINSIFMFLNQLGIGPGSGFSITDNTAVWSDYLPNGSNIEAVKSYMILRVKSIFDPSPTSFGQESFNKIIEEAEWRLVIQKENPYVEPSP